MIKLFHFPICPFSRRVRLSLCEMNVAFSMINENIWDERREFLALNPAGTLPLIIDEDDNIIINTYAIIEYIEEKFKDDNTNLSYISGDIYQKAEIRRLIDWFDNKFHREVTKVIIRELIDKYYQKDELDNTSPNMELVRLAQENSSYHFDYISHLINSRRWIGGDALSQADFAAAAHISCLDYLGKVDWDRWVTLKNWYARIKSRPSFSPILEDNIAGFRPPAYYSNPDF
ncbi:MAG: glutathione S-transferase [Rhodobiaceae bacterium]|uniref:Glutathione S-transferase family protein n=1 Tax=PS1 clade bacterium TaxID=2175152 RepID=A0A368DK59_9PROT|nr:glutathione S-transferase [Rhodobiaceae bacterium]OUT74695.1 MAG: hypothetical protein CBB85_01505 [Rhizobiales bacterium TMED25]RCL72034.1 MAG: glutathione S-transferase family protein [PS1 clade bacterium]